MQFFYSALLKGHFSSHLFDKKGIQKKLLNFALFQCCTENF